MTVTTSNRITTRFADLVADASGDDDGRPALVLLHGLSFDRTSWRPVLDELDALDPGRHVVAVDLPGHGASPDVGVLRPRGRRRGHPCRGASGRPRTSGPRRPLHLGGHRIDLCRPVPDDRRGHRRHDAARRPLRRARSARSTTSSGAPASPPCGRAVFEASMHAELLTRRGTGARALRRGERSLGAAPSERLPSTVASASPCATGQRVEGSVPPGTCWAGRSQPDARRGGPGAGR